MRRELLERLNDVARRREDRAAIELRAAAARRLRAEQTQRQLLAYGDEYRRSALEVLADLGAGARSDSLAFGQRLQAVAGEQAPQLDFHREGESAARRALLAANRRSDMYRKLLETQRRREQREADRRQLLEVEESITARAQGRGRPLLSGGTKSALSRRLTP